MADKREVDEHSQRETTGHEWDGIKELDTPMPRWWLLTFYATIIWGIAYFIMMPSWPLVSKAMPGLLGYSSRETVENEIAAARAATAPLDAEIANSDLSEVASDPDLLRYATAGGGAVFRNHCSQCHGAGAAGNEGYPNLLDDEWLWGGGIDAIHQTVSHGIRSEEDGDTRFSQMPAFGEILAEEEIDQLVHYVLALSGQDHDAELAEPGSTLFADNCVSCHGEDGTGMIEQGAPDLTNAIWLYGGDEQAIRYTITNARYGIMPSFTGRLSDADLRKVAVYVHSLGGGQ